MVKWYLTDKGLRSSAALWRNGNGTTWIEGNASILIVVRLPRANIGRLPDMPGQVIKGFDILHISQVSTSMFAFASFHGSMVTAGQFAICIDVNTLSIETGDDFGIFSVVSMMVMTTMTTMTTMTAMTAMTTTIRLMTMTFRIREDALGFDGLSGHEGPTQEQGSHDKESRLHDELDLPKTRKNRHPDLVHVVSLIPHQEKGHV